MPEPVEPPALLPALPSEPPPIPEAPVDVSALPTVPWRWAESLAVFALAIATSLLLSGIIASISRGDVGKASAIIAFEVALGFWAFMWVRVRFGLGLRALGFHTERLASDVGAGVVTGLSGIVFASIIVGQIVVKIVESLSSKPVKAPEQLDFTSPSAAVLTVTAIGVIVAAPIAEELFFRGLVYQGFRRRLGVVPAALLSAGMFGLAHVPFWLIMPSIATLGILLAVTFERRASVVPTMVAHATFNAVGFIAYLVTLHR